MRFKLQSKPVPSPVFGLRSPIRLSIVAFLHEATFRASMFDWQTLRDYGFNLPFHSYEGQRPCYYDRTANSIFSTSLCSLQLSSFNIASGYNFYNRRLIEIACGYNSTLCRFTKYSAKCDCIRVTSENDICSSSR